MQETKSIEQLEEKLEKVHKSDWHPIAAASGWIAILLPILSEFEGIGQEFFMGIGGASAASVFAIILKIGRVSSMVSSIKEEQYKIHKEGDERDKKIKRETRKRKKLSEYSHDPIGWCDSELK